MASTDPQSRPWSLGISQFIVKLRELLDSDPAEGRKDPQAPRGAQGKLSLPTTLGLSHAHINIVVRVRPWASEGITDLLSASGCGYLV